MGLGPLMPKNIRDPAFECSSLFRFRRYGFVASFNHALWASLGSAVFSLYSFPAAFTFTGSFALEPVTSGSFPSYDPSTRVANGTPSSLSDLRTLSSFEFGTLSSYPASGIQTFYSHISTQKVPY